MALLAAWYIAPYKTDPLQANSRYCAVNDQTALIQADGGNWAECELLNNKAVVKVSCNSSGTLTNLDKLYTRLPVDKLTDKLNKLNQAQIQRLNDFLLQAGVTQAEIDAVIGDFTSRSLGDVLSLANSKANHKPLAVLDLEI